LDAISNASVPFEQQYGVGVKFELMAASGDMATKLIAENGHPDVDVFLGGSQALYKAATAGIMAPLTEDQVPNLANVISIAKPELNNTLYYSGIYGDVWGWALRTDLIPASMAYNGSWRWFLDSRLKGKLAVHDPTWADLPAWAALVYGGDDHHYDPAFGFFKDLAPNLKFVFSTDAEATNALSTGDVWGVFEVSTIIYGLAQQGVKVQMVFPEDVPTVDGIKSPINFDFDAIGVVNGGKTDLAYKFVNYILGPEGQYAYCVLLGNAPVNNQTKAMPPDLAPYLLTGAQLKRAWSMDTPYYATVEDHLIERWEQEIVPLIGKDPAPTFNISFASQLNMAWVPVAVGVAALQWKRIA